MPTTIRVSSLLVVLAALASAACTPLFSKNPSQWRDGRVTSVVSLNAIPGGIDKHCLGTPGDSGSDMVAVITIRLGRRMAGYRLAIPISDGQLLHVGDDVIVQPQPCKLESSGVQPD